MAGENKLVSSKILVTFTVRRLETGENPPQFLALGRYRSVVENDETQILEICAIEKKSSFGKLEKEIGCGTE